jgi:PAS domain S-box-containing protein
MPAIFFDKPTERNTEALKTEIALMGCHETKLSASESRYRTILENITEGYFEVDVYGNFTFFNDAMCQILGYTRDELMGINNRQYMDKKNATKVFHTFNRVYKTQKIIKALDWELIKKNGSRCFVETSVLIILNPAGKPSGFRGIARDVTERRKAEKEKEKLRKQLQQFQQKEIIGTLASGIAHDFNNILSSILGYAELSLLSLDQAQKNTGLHDNIANVVAAGNYAKDLVKQILTISRNGEKKTHCFNVIPKINEALKILQSNISPEINFQQNVCNDQLMVNGDSTQIQRVVFNLVINAQQAMNNAAGRIKVCVHSVNSPIDLTEKYQNPTPGQYVRISVCDTGVGIPKHNLEKIFNPYFTTKDTGTGLGLSIVYSIVKSHNGHINVDSNPGKGSSFHIYLPLTKGEIADRPYKFDQ